MLVADATVHAPWIADTASPERQRARSAWLTNAALALLGIVYVELTRTGVHEFHHFVHGFSESVFGQLMLYLGAIALVERSPTNRWTLPLILLAAFAARLFAVAAPPFLSSDVYRYVWDGMVQAAGINPFRYIPADSHLGFLRDAAIYPSINRREYAHTIYPPGAQFLFLLITRVQASVPWMKLALVGLEGLTCWALMQCLALLRLPRERVLLYAWHPVCIWEIGSSGHIDAAALTAIALALLARLRGRPLRAAGWLGAAALIKLYPAALLPALVQRRLVAPALLFAALLVGGYLPYLSVGRGVLGFLPAYAREEGLDSGTRYFPLAWMQRTFHVSFAPTHYLAVCCIVLVACAWWAFQQGRSATGAIQGGLVLATTMNLCFSPHYPWYFLWLLPFLTLWPWRPAFYLVLAVTYMLATRLGMPGEPLYRMNTFLYGGFVLLLVLDAAGSRLAALPGWRRLRDCLPPVAQHEPQSAASLQESSS
ncbi:glycosyltransferase 87 family protein [Acidipila sp. EB88]|uniref:glycosyltransferase 87 family protein n=1 Tax=Acidipila sp. EB88 TaxID=2305226 RepID=UPI00131598AB|nr:glycosyltransferase 87 family protein [Acidipila sp. EB88]